MFHFCHLEDLFAAEVVDTLSVLVGTAPVCRLEDPFVTEADALTVWIGAASVCQLDDTVVADAGTVSVWLGPPSHVTTPEPSISINLYSNTVPGTRYTTADQSGLVEVYCDALSEIASSVSQLPRAEMFPELMV